MNVFFETLAYFILPNKYYIFLAVNLEYKIDSHVSNLPKNKSILPQSINKKTNALLNRMLISFIKYGINQSYYVV